MSPVPIFFTPGWREAKWIKIACLRKQRDWGGLNPGPSDPALEVLTARLQASIWDKTERNWVYTKLPLLAIQTSYYVTEANKPMKYLTFLWCLCVRVVVVVWSGGKEEGWADTFLWCAATNVKAAFTRHKTNFRLVKNLTGQFVYTWPFNILALFTRSWTIGV